MRILDFALGTLKHCKPSYPINTNDIWKYECEIIADYDSVNKLTW